MGRRVVVLRDDLVLVAVADLVVHDQRGRLTPGFWLSPRVEVAPLWRTGWPRVCRCRCGGVVTAGASSSNAAARRSPSSRANLPRQQPLSQRIRADRPKTMR